MKVYFWGAGKIGKYWLRQWKNFGIEPKGIIDNNRDLWGTMFNGIIIYNPIVLTEVSFDYVFVTCNRTNEIIQQLYALGIVEDKIVADSHSILNRLLYYAVKNMTITNNVEILDNSFTKRKIIFDLYNGMVLGGVESWSYSLAKSLSQLKYEGVYLTIDMSESLVMDETYPVCKLRYSELKGDSEMINRCMEKLIEYLPCTVICNFPQHIFLAACIVKHLYPEWIRIVAVQHNDDPLYYNTYTLWQNYLDCYMIISSRIEEKLLSLGMEQNKVRHLDWQISCKETLDRTWRKEGVPLQIGYAGRVTIMQKRLDLFFVLAQTLKRKQVDFQITIAGAGDYGETLQERIKEEKLQDQMNFIGRIERENIPDFWQKQDIMISCSEWEGHSISQAEAMAEGAVPVITDVSGARDDVTDGYNGFVVAIGDIEAMAEKISYLYHNPEVLETMGIRAHDTVYNRQKDIDQTVFWEELLEEVWQS